MNKLHIDTSSWCLDFEKLFFSHAWSKVKDSEIAADLVQDTFLAGLNGIDKFEGNSTVKTWLFSILKRKIIDHWRTKSRRKTETFSYYNNMKELDNSAFEYFIQSNDENVEQALEKKELRRILLTSIDTLPKNWIPIVVDRLIEQDSCELISEKHDLSINNVWVIMFRAKAKLRKNLTNRLDLAS